MMKKQVNYKKLSDKLFRYLNYSSKDILFYTDDIDPEDFMIKDLLEKVEETIQEKFYTKKEIKNFIFKLNNLILAYASHKYTKRLKFTNDDVIDSLITSVHFLGEELNYSTVTTTYLMDVFNSIGEMMLVVNNTRNILFFNQTTLDVLGYDSNDVKARDIKFLFEKEDEVELLQSNQKEHIKVNFRKANNEILPVYIRVSDFQQTDNPLLGQVIIARDISMLIKHQHEIENKNLQIIEKNKELQKALEKAEESDRLKSAFLANMSHEIRTPMNGILGFAEILKKQNLDPEKQKQLLSIIQQSGERMLNIINDIVDISKIESGTVEVRNSEFNINDKLDELYNFFKRETDSKGLDFICRKVLPKHNSIIISDEHKVVSVLTNLLKNAIKFTKEGSIEFGYKKRTEHLEFFVKDTGVGISEEKKEVIFERFRQGSEKLNRNYEGAGLGLTISKAYLDMLEGEIWVESNENLGSAFYFTIPLVFSAINSNPIEIEKEEEIQVEELELKRKNLNILIVEDDENSANYLKMLLSDKNYLLYATNGKEAVDVCKRNNDIDIILMDLKLPVLNGFRATSEIRTFNKDVIIIAQTAFAFESDKEKALAKGCNDFLTKPFTEKLLFETINKYL